MSTDDTGRVEEPKLDIWQLPRALNVRVERVRFEPPRLHVVQGKESRVNEATAVVIETDGAFPIRAASPVLFVGSVALTESESVGTNQYRFLALDGEPLRDGAPIWLGWTGVREPLQNTGLEYRSTQT